MDEQVPDYGSNLTYSLAHLVINRHLYGPGHGPSAQDIAVSQHTYSFAYGVDITRSWSAKILNNSLYLHGNLVLRNSNKKGDERLLGEFVERMSHILVCPHLQPPRGVLSDIPIMPELARDHVSGGDFFPTSGEIKSCRVCFTDYQIDVTLESHPRPWYALPRPMEEDWVIKIARWHKLGECRSPHDLEWRNLVNRYEWGPGGRQDICAAGMVHREWMGGNMSSADEIEGTLFLGSQQE